MDSQNNLSSRVKLEGKEVFAVLVALILIVSLSGAFFYNESRALEKNPNKVNEEKITALVNKVGMLIALPEGELPTIATVTDLKPLADKPFFAKANIGDEVLLYTAAKKAFLYNPSSNIIVEVASLNIGK